MYRFVLPQVTLYIYKFASFAQLETRYVSYRLNQRQIEPEMYRIELYASQGNTKYIESLRKTS